MVYSLVEEILMRENMTPHSFPYLEILNNLDIGIALFDAEGNYLFVNTELVNWRNIPMLEFLKMNVHDFLNTLDVCVFDLVKKKNHRVSRLQYYKNKDHVDSKRRLRVVTGTPIFDENGKIKYVDHGHSRMWRVLKTYTRSHPAPESDRQLRKRKRAGGRR